MSAEEIEIQTINHLGLIAGIIDDIGLEQIINKFVGSDSRELVTSGQVVKAIILNGLGFVSKPLYLFPQFFEDKATEHLLGQGVDVHGKYLDINSITNKTQEVSEQAIAPITITKGYSRDHRPDLKQFIMDLIVSGDGGVPLFLRVA
jgi:transposase